MPKILITFFLLSGTVFGQVNKELPELGDRVSGAISDAEVELLSEQFLQQVYSQAALSSMIARIASLIGIQIFNFKRPCLKLFSALGSVNFGGSPSIARLICFF